LLLKSINIKLFNKKLCRKFGIAASLGIEICIFCFLLNLFTPICYRRKIKLSLPDFRTENQKITFPFLSGERTETDSTVSARAFELQNFHSENRDFPSSPHIP